MVFERPRRPGAKPQSSRPTRPQPGDRVNVESNNGPSPWLAENSNVFPQPHPSASFIEYLRWMRSLNQDKDSKDFTKLQILQMAERAANYEARFKKLNERIKKIVGEGNYFKVTCPWRIRVGGHRGPESILLPAFDALGMPYIPSSTLRGVAREQAIREMATKENLSRFLAEVAVAPWFGIPVIPDKDGEASEEQKQNHECKVIFLDAYPTPDNTSGGLSIDIANNIWNWDAASRDLFYSPNPNHYFSLAKVTFLVGIRPTKKCNSSTFGKIKDWLIQGLEAGIGSQVNSGYGSLVVVGEMPKSKPFFSVEFSLQGQLIHGCQQAERWDHERKRSIFRAKPEVRAIAFKSAMRYWFRAIGRGVLPGDKVRELEGKLFGAIDPQSRGWVRFQIREGRLVQPEARNRGDLVGEQSGHFELFLSSEIPSDKKEEVKSLMGSLVWLTFHLGGVGQGARRPCYSRRNRDRAPWWRGSTLIIESEDDFWDLPENPKNFAKRIRKRLKEFYYVLSKLSGLSINPNDRLEAGIVSSDRWTEAVDKNCRMIVCSGKADFGKLFALAILHSEEFKKNGDYDENLCGSVQGIAGKPSPVWIADSEDFQTVTIFGYTHNPRGLYCKRLEEKSDFYEVVI